MGPGCRGSPTRPPPARCAAGARGLQDIPGIAVRVIEYTVESEDGTQASETFTLVTDITDPVLLSPQQAAAAYASRWQLETCFDELGNLDPRRGRRRAAVEVPAHDPPGNLRHALLLPGDPHPDQPRRRRRRHRSQAESSTRARDAVRGRISDPGAFSPDSLSDLVADLAFEITCKRNLVPGLPAAATPAKPNGQAAGTRPASPARPPG